MHPETICDLHPTCDDGEDELDCEKKYKEKRVFDSTKTFPCISPMYATSGRGNVTILSAPCDGRPECWEGLDEWGCDGLPDWATVLFIG
jgi:hypothetical protein